MKRSPPLAKTLLFSLMEGSLENFAAEACLSRVLKKKRRETFVVPFRKMRGLAEEKAVSTETEKVSRVK